MMHQIAEVLLVIEKNTESRILLFERPHFARFLSMRKADFVDRNSEGAFGWFEWGYDIVG